IRLLRICATTGRGDTLSLSREEAARGVHATHDLHIHRPIRSGDRLTTVATTVGIEQRKPGAYRVQRFDTHDADDRAVCTTYNGALMIDVPVAGEDRWTEALPAIPEVPASDARPRCFEIAVGHGLAHVYTECARIWNPIHTDRAVALRAALPDIILHGTATLGLALSKLIDGILEGAPARVRRVCWMPSTLTLEITGATESEIAFRVLTADGSAAISAGYVAFV
ncbi:MAG: MaoC/PaaZ C-terminal domain-containing protein, partial [Gammaproteobacteria bacterium]